MNILITKSVADWFDDEWIEIDVKKYNYFTLHACGLRWDLRGHYRNPLGAAVYHQFDLAPSLNVKQLVKILDVREIEGNQDKKPKDLFN